MGADAFDAGIEGDLDETDATTGDAGIVDEAADGVDPSAAIRDLGFDEDDVRGRGRHFDPENLERCLKGEVRFKRRRHEEPLIPSRGDCARIRKLFGDRCTAKKHPLSLQLYAHARCSPFHPQ